MFTILLDCFFASSGMLIAKFGGIEHETTRKIGAPRLGAAELQSLRLACEVADKKIFN